MDTYTKGVLTVIAAALVVIAFNMSLRPEQPPLFRWDQRWAIGSRLYKTTTNTPIPGML